MAIYHLHSKVITRSKGQNVVASAAYRRADRLYCEDTHEHFDFSHKRNVVHSEIVIPEKAPAWAAALVSLHEESETAAAELLWNQVEIAEKRKDAQLARELEFSLPIELDQSKNIQLAREFITDQFCKRGMIADWNVHWDAGNPHVHVMLTMRSLVDEGFGAKVRSWNAKALHDEWRLKWAEYANFHLALNQQDARIDHRSYQAQGIDLIPSIHEGKAVRDMEQRGIVTERLRDANEIRLANLKKIVDQPNVLLDKMTHQWSDFSSQQVAHEFGRYINDKGRFSYVIADQALQTFLENEARQDGLGELVTKADVEQIFKQIEDKSAVFSEREIASAISATLANHTDNAGAFAQALLRVKASDVLIPIGPGEDGRDRYTTRGMFALENDCQALADELYGRSGHGVKGRRASRFIKQYDLSAEQAGAIRHVLADRDIAAIVGRAGTGKSYALQAARCAWEDAGFRVLGITLSAVAADGLQKGAGITSSTIAAFQLALENEKVVLSDRDVLVMDEAGMTDNRSMQAVLNVVSRAGAKLVLVGDHAQVQPVGPGAPFRALLERIGFAELNQIRRQDVAWQCEATRLFSQGKVAAGLEAYHKHGLVHLDSASTNAAMKRLIDVWQADCLGAEPAARGQPAEQVQTLHEHLILAYRNDDVAQLNRLARAARVKTGGLDQGFLCQAHQGDIHVAQGERLMFLKNDVRLGVKNGLTATVTEMEVDANGRVAGISVALDGAKDKVKTVHFNPNQYHAFTYGYAATVHKTQGVTVDKTYVLAAGNWVRSLVYVAMSRHRQSAQLFADKGSYRDFETLKLRMSRRGTKDSVFDYPLSFLLRRGLDPNNLSGFLKPHLKQKLLGVKQALVDRYEQLVRPVHYWTKKEALAAEDQIKLATLKRREDARLVYEYTKANREAGKAWGALRDSMTQLGLKSVSTSASTGSTPSSALGLGAFDDPAQRKAAFELLRGDAVHQTLQDALTNRNALAFRLQQDVQRYHQALVDEYAISLDKLAQQAQAHQCLMHVQAYAKEVALGRVIHRDRVALVIAADMRGHYKALCDHKINIAELRRQANAQARREVLLSLDAKAKNDFYVVDQYMALARQSQRCWARVRELQLAEKMVPRRLLAQAEQINNQRDQLAFTIHQNPQRYHVGLQHFELRPGDGAEPLKTKHPDKIAVNINRNTAASEQPRLRQYADQRWQALEKRAARVQAQLRVNAYMTALLAGDMTQLQSLGHEIAANTRLHHPAIISQSKRPKETWMAIRADAKLYARAALVKTLTPAERANFDLVERYVHERRDTAQTWGEIYATKTPGVTVPKELYDVAKSHSIPRDQLAAQIKAHPEAFKAGLDFYQLKLEDFDKSVKAHACRERVRQFKDSMGSVHERINLAQHIVRDKKAHHGAVMDFKVNWKRVYRYADVGVRLERLSQLTPAERMNYRKVAEYQQHRRQAGRLWGEIFKDQNNDNQIIAMARFNEARLVAAQRDQLAALLQQNAERYQDYYDELRVKKEHILKHAQAHQRRVLEVRQYADKRQQLLQTFHEVAGDRHDNRNTRFDKANAIGLKDQPPISMVTLALNEDARYVQWRKQWDELMEQARVFVRQEQYQLTLTATGLDKSLPQEDLTLTQQLDHALDLNRTKVRSKTQSSQPQNQLPNQKNQQYQIKQQNHWDVNAVSRALEQDTERFVRSLLGEPKFQSSREMRYGRKGSLCVPLTGEKRGLWYDFEAGVGGGLLKLIERELNCDFKSALNYAGQYLGMTPEAFKTEVLKYAPRKSTNNQNGAVHYSLADQEARKYGYIKQLERESKPVENTIAARYLREHRGLTGSIPKDFRFHAGVWEGQTQQNYPALLVFARDQAGRVRAVQRIYLDKTSADKLAIDRPKRSYGSLANNFVLVQEGSGSNAKTVLAEGPETALSIAQADKNLRVFATLGIANMGRFDWSIKDQSIILAADNDGPQAKSNKMLDKAAQQLAESGLNVYCAKPRTIKTDFNDLLRDQGINAVKQTLQQAILYQPALEPKTELKAVEQHFAKQMQRAQRTQPSNKRSAPQKQTAPITSHEHEWELLKQSGSKEIEAIFKYQQQLNSTSNSQERQNLNKEYDETVNKLLRSDDMVKLEKVGPKVITEVRNRFYDKHLLPEQQQLLLHPEWASLNLAEGRQFKDTAKLLISAREQILNNVTDPDKVKRLMSPVTSLLNKTMESKPQRGHFKNTAPNLYQHVKQNIKTLSLKFGRDQGMDIERER